MSRYLLATSCSFDTAELSYLWWSCWWWWRWLLCCLVAGSITTDWPEHCTERTRPLWAAAGDISLSLSLWWAESLNPSQVARQPADSEIMVVIISYYTRYPPSSLLLDQPRIYTIKSITGSRLSLAGDNTSLLALLWRPERQAGSGKFKITELQPVRSGQVQH